MANQVKVSHQLIIFYSTNKKCYILYQPSTHTVIRRFDHEATALFVSIQLQCRFEWRIKSLTDDLPF